MDDRVSSTLSMHSFWIKWSPLHYIMDGEKVKNLRSSSKGRKMLNVLIWTVIVLTIVLLGYQVFQIGLQMENVLLSAMGAGIITLGLLLPIMYKMGRE